MATKGKTQDKKIGSASVSANEAIPTGPNYLKREPQQSDKWYFNFKIQALIIAMLAIVFYCNTFQHEFALDDTVVILKNEYVHEGFEGIPGIMTKDAFFSYYRQLNSSNQLSGGRYRPLSILTFAIEQQFFGTVPDIKSDSLINYGISYEQELPYEKKFIQEMHIRHIVNVLLYALAGIVLLWFLRYIIFKTDHAPAFIAAILFIVHPIHTEVVANVKSRDELMSLTFICLTFIFAFRYRENKDKTGFLVAGILSYFLAFLSKEYAITLVILLPLSFYLFKKDTIRKSIIASLPYFAVAIVYLLIRLQAIGIRDELSDNDIQINPYALASAGEKIATEIATSMNYLKLLLYPHPLSSDYSYNQIPYKNFASPLVWLSLVVHGGLVFGLVYFLRKRSVFCFAIAFYLLNLLMVNNFLFDIGATMGERLIFHASVGFVIAAACLINNGVESVNKAKLKRVLLTGLMFAIIVLSGYNTIERNKDWKNDETLFFHDVTVSPNSFLVNANVACMLINKSDYEKDERIKNDDLHRGVALYTKVISMQQDYVTGYLNRCIGYLKLNQADSMVSDLDRINALYPIHPQLPLMYYRAGMLYYHQKQYDKAIAALMVSLKLNPDRFVLDSLDEVKKVKEDKK